ncbi:restriction endonuclease [Paenibacillus larvae]|uniref:DNA topoisomerase I n=2 Tax=Paenibacillus larvae TaxID=1464 RepID=A0A2L1U7C5_9BACL|nr:restriction endonuclease [Paenibacillus larvae]AVF28844.1 DNA topoisomerase I [Paenibacillus larvae subsp. larvae]MCY9500304.1 restriction endonuclease [Paenibacillus larvae]MDR5608740.1 restriction endonuclease [Paenibacillus larvae]
MTSLIIIILTLLCGFTIYKGFRKRKQALIWLRSGIQDIDKMDGRQFEFYLKALFDKLGYKAEVTKGSHDFGADLVFDGKKRIVVQAKRYGYKDKVGIKAVQEVYAAKTYYKAKEAWVITNSKYSGSAKELAKACEVTLMDRNDLQNFIVKVNPEVKPSDIRNSVEPAARKCPLCRSPLVVRRSNEGNSFMGCSSFPHCRHTEKIAN